jgi:hypothetical protein
VAFELTPEYSRSDCANSKGIKGMFSGVGLTVPAFSAASKGEREQERAARRDMIVLRWALASPPQC